MATDAEKAYNEALRQLHQFMKPTDEALAAAAAEAMLDGTGMVEVTIDPDDAKPVSVPHIPRSWLCAFLCEKNNLPIEPDPT